MNPMLLGYGALGLAIACEVAGSALLLKSEQFTRMGPMVGMGVLYVAAFFFLSQALKVMPLGVAYAIWAGLGIVLTAIVGVVAFRQVIDLAAFIGIGLIVGGVVVMQVFSQATGH